MSPLVACPTCSTHVAASERSCPFCGRALRGADGHVSQTTAAVLLGLSVGGVACPATPVYGVAEDVTVTTTSGVSPSGGGPPGCADPSPIPPGGPFPSPAEAQAMCSQVGELVGALDMPGLQVWLPRRWLYCDGPPLFARSYPGVEFVSDGNWWFLEEMGGELVRSTSGGTWRPEGPPCSAATVAFNEFGEGVFIVPVLSIDPLTLELQDTRFVAIGEGPVGQGGAGGTGGAGGAP